jgi:hypothetical protein
MNTEKCGEPVSAAAMLEFPPAAAGAKQRQKDEG